jgi:subtilase family serine protease
MALLGALLSNAASALPPEARTGASIGSPARPVCSVPAGTATARCHALAVTDASGRAATFAAPAGYGPADLRDAYRITGQGKARTTIAVVVAYHDATAEADLKPYRKTFGLPPCTAAGGCFRQVDQRGGQDFPPPNLGWSQEQALDLELAGALCPHCSLLVVEADSAGFGDLAAAVDEAAALGAHAITNSFGAGEAGTLAWDPHWNHPGIAISASSGSDGPQFPASSEFVTAVGGTTLSRSGNARGWREIAFGSGACSALFAKPSWQKDTLCSRRTLVDVAAVADPSTGVAVFAPQAAGASAWMVFGGTSVSAAIIAGVYGANGHAVAYGSDPYRHPGALFDIVHGGDGGCGAACEAGPGYDPPTGMGTPDGVKAFGASRGGAMP